MAQLVVEVGVVEPQVQAAALEGLGELARVVGGEQDDGLGLGFDAAELGDRDLEIGEDLEEHGLELLVGLVDLVDEQDDGVGAGDGRHQRPLQEEVLAEDVALDVLPAGVVGLGLDTQQLLAVVPLVERLGLVESLVALQAHEAAIEVAGQSLGQFGLTHPGRPLDEDGLAEHGGQKGDERGRLAGQVADVLEALSELVDGCWGGHRAFKYRLCPAMLVLPATVSNLGALAALMGFGFVLASFGHLISSRVVIMAGILVIGIVSAYVAFVPGSQ